MSDVKHLSKLCRIHLDDKEEADLTKKLGRILSYVDQLTEVDTEDVKPCDHVLETTTTPMRDDVVVDTLTRKEYLSNAPDQVGGMIRVPPVFEEV